MDFTKVRVLLTDGGARQTMTILHGLKEIGCILKGYDDGKLTVEAGKETITFEKSEVALVRLRVEF